MSQIDEMRKQIIVMDGQLVMMASQNFPKSSTLRFMRMLADEMRKQGLGKFRKHIGRFSIRISEVFFEDNARAERMTRNFVATYKKLYDALVEEFGEDADVIFSERLYCANFTA